MITQLTCLKNKKEKDTQPDYRLSANVGSKDQPRYVDIGAGWIKEGEKGKFISFQLSKPYNGKKGWQVVEIQDEVENVTLASEEMPF